MRMAGEDKAGAQGAQMVQPGAGNKAQCRSWEGAWPLQPGDMWLKSREIGGNTGGAGAPQGLSF